MATVVPDIGLKGSSKALFADDVFIVEDEPIARRALQYLLLNRGYSVAVFETAEEALKAAVVRGLPRVILMDLNLPGMNGMDAIRQFERACPTIFPVLITAAGIEELDRLRGKHTVACLAKPLDFSRLVTLLERRHQTN